MKTKPINPEHFCPFYQFNKDCTHKGKNNPPTKKLVKCNHFNALNCIYYVSSQSEAKDAKLKAQKPNTAKSTRGVR